MSVEVVKAVVVVCEAVSVASVSVAVRECESVLWQ